MGAAINAAGDVAYVQRDGPVRFEGDVLLTYGAGGALQRSAISQYRTAGKRVVTLDLGYWNRSAKDSNQCWRWSINGHQPSAELVARGGDCYEQETEHAVQRIRYNGDPNGHVLFCLAGRKSQAAFPAMVEEERRLLDQARAAFGPRLRVRAKPTGATSIRGSDTSAMQSFTSALMGCAYVISHSSNASVEAAQAGVPFFCTAGIGLAYSAPKVTEIPRPPPAEPLLRRAGYFQVSARMIKQGLAWPRIRSLL